jgi:hypothetical protein
MFLEAKDGRAALSLITADPFEDAGTVMQYV